MPKPVLLNIILKVLKDKGFFFVRQKGSHARFRKIGNKKDFVIFLAYFDKLSPKSYDYFGLWLMPRTQKAANSYTMNRLY